MRGGNYYDGGNSGRKPKEEEKSLARVTLSYVPLK